MPKLVDIGPQGGEKWLDWRRTKITASNAGVILGLCPYKTPLQLYNQILEGTEEPDNHFMRHGRETEPEAREWTRVQTGDLYEPGCFESTDYPWMAASLDGWNPKAFIKLVEFKCPKKRIEQFALLTEIPPTHYAQMQHQLAVMETDKCYYVTYSKEDSDGVIITVKRDDAFIEKMIVAEKAFYKRILAFDPPDPIDGSDIEVLDDPEAQEALDRYKTWCKEIEVLEALKLGERNFLIDKASGKSVRIGDSKITKVITKGRIDYGAIEALKEIDLEPYRKPNSTSWRIS